MADIDPAAVMAAHSQHDSAQACGAGAGNEEWCEPYRLAQALAAERRGTRMYERALSAVEHQLDWHVTALAAEQARVARVVHFCEASIAPGTYPTMVRLDGLMFALADQPEQEQAR